MTLETQESIVTKILVIMVILLIVSIIKYIGEKAKRLRRMEKIKAHKLKEEYAFKHLNRGIFPRELRPCDRKKDKYVENFPIAYLYAPLPCCHIWSNYNYCTKCGTRYAKEEV